MTIAEFHRLYKLVSDKSGSDYTSHEEIDDLANIAQLEYFSMLIGNFRQHQPGRPVPPVVVGQTSRTGEELSPFKSTIAFFTQPYDPTTAPYGVTDGVLALPLDYEHMSGVDSLFVKNGEARVRPVQEMDDEEWAGRVDSAMMPPTKQEPIYRYYGKGGTLNGFDIGEKKKLEFRPKDISGNLTYYRKPAKPNYVYTINTTTRVETHDANASTDLEWGEVATMNILVRTLQLAGIKQADQMLYQAMGADKMQDE